MCAITPYLDIVGEKPRENHYYRLRRWLIKENDNGTAVAKLEDQSRTRYTQAELLHRDTIFDCMDAYGLGDNYYLYYNGLFVINLKTENISVPSTMPSKTFTLAPIKQYNVLFYDNARNLLPNQTLAFKSLMIMRGGIEAASVAKTQTSVNTSAPQSFQSWRFRPINVAVSSSNINTCINLRNMSGACFTYLEYDKSDLSCQKKISGLDTNKMHQFKDVFIILTNMELRYDPNSFRTYVHADIHTIFVEK